MMNRYYYIININDYIELEYNFGDVKSLVCVRI